MRQRLDSIALQKPWRPGSDDWRPCLASEIGRGETGAPVATLGTGRAVRSSQMNRCQLMHCVVGHIITARFPSPIMQCISLLVYKRVLTVFVCSQKQCKFERIAHRTTPYVYTVTDLHAQSVWIVCMTSIMLFMRS